MKDEPTKTLRIEPIKIMSGHTLANKYRILRELGRGGMGVVYEAEDLKLKRTVALKFLPPELTADPEARERFIHEAQAASSLDHPNICTIHEIDEAEGGGLFIAMACYKGESLREKIKKGALEAAEVIEIALQVAEGLAKAHEQGIVHRDIKPGNIFITSDGIAKILDFGLAKLAGEARLTLPGTTMGTVAYMSPEQARGENVDERTDIWSLGIILYEMVTGELPFGGHKEQAIIYAILHEQPRPVKDLRPGFPGELEQVIRKALAKDPAKRFASVRELTDALQGLKTRLSPHHYPTTERLSFRRPRKRLLVAAAAVSVAVFALVIWMLSRPSLAFESRDKLMVADADNLTGEAVFDLALRTAIEADLQQSPYAAIFDKPQISEILRLMRKDPSSRIDEKLGYEICRFAGVRAFLLPRILSAGEAYEIQAILIDPVRQRHVDRIRVTARGREEVLLHGIDKLAQQVRSRLGESLQSIEKADKSIVQVTTSSWEALNYFSMGQAKWQEGKHKETVQFFELALEKDPQFVDARGSLGLVLIQFLDQKKKGQKMLRQALENAKSQDLTQRDLLKLKAVNRQFVDEDLPGALEEYKAIQELFPDFMPPFNNSGRILLALKRYDEAVVMFEKAAQLAPRNSIPLQNLWFTLMNFIKDSQSAENVARRMVNLAPETANSHSYLGFSLAVQGRFEEAEKELRKTVELESQHPYGLPNLAHVLLASGKPAEAIPIYREILELVKQGRIFGTQEAACIALAKAMQESGQIEDAKRVAAEGREALEKKLSGSSASAQDWLNLGALEAAGGELNRADQYLKRALTAGVDDPYTMMSLAELYALTGKADLALETLKKSIDAGYSDPYFPMILPAFLSIRNQPEFRALFKLGE